MELNTIMYILAGLLLVGVIIAIIKKVAKFILIIGLFGVIALALIGTGLSDKPLKDMNLKDWQEVTQKQYDKYKEEIENNPEVQAVYNKMVETASGAMDSVKEKAMQELIKQLETMTDDDYRINQEQTNVEENKGVDQEQVVDQEE